MTESPCGPRPGGAILSGPPAPETYAGPPETRNGSSGTSSKPVPQAPRSEHARPSTADLSLADATHQRPLHTTGSHRRMDAKQVWRAALGELQVSLSPANFETWLRDTQLVDVDEQRFRIAVPNGFAKDWLETRYRSLISQTLARIVGYSVQVAFVIVAATAGSDASDQPDAPESPPATPQVRLEPGRVGGE